MLHIPIVHAHDVSKQISREKKFENVIKQLVHTSACVHGDMKHLGSLESTQEARVALGYASSNSYASLCSPNFPRASYLDERMLRYEPIVN